MKAYTPLPLTRPTQGSGFTLVELLIVIVVIAILAVISVVTFSGIQDRAYNTQVVSGVSQFRKVVETYKSLEGDYPKTSRELSGEHIAMACLGEGHQDGECGVVSAVVAHEDSAFNQRLRSVIGSGGAVASVNRTVGPESFTGAVYGIDFVHDGVRMRYVRTLQWALIGADTDCKVAGASAYRLQESPPLTACIIILEIMPSSYCPVNRPPTVTC